MSATTAVELVGNRPYSCLAEHFEDRSHSITVLIIAYLREDENPLADPAFEKRAVAVEISRTSLQSEVDRLFQYFKLHCRDQYWSRSFEQLNAATKAMRFGNSVAAKDQIEGCLFQFFFHVAREDMRTMEGDLFKPDALPCDVLAPHVRRAQENAKALREIVGPIFCIDAMGLNKLNKLSKDLRAQGQLSAAIVVLVSTQFQSSPLGSELFSDLLKEGRFIQAIEFAYKIGDRKHLIRQIIEKMIQLNLLEDAPAVAQIIYDKEIRLHGFGPRACEIPTFTLNELFDVIFSLHPSLAVQVAQRLPEPKKSAALEKCVYALQAQGKAELAVGPALAIEDDARKKSALKALGILKDSVPEET